MHVLRVVRVMRYGLLCACVCWRYCGVGEERLLAQAFAAIYFVDKKYVIRKIEMIA